MKIQTKILFIILTLSFISCKDVAQKTETNKAITETVSSEVEKISVPKLIGVINDYGQLFSKSEQTELTKILQDYETATTRQIVVVTVDDISPYKDIQKYATYLGQSWQIGTAEENNGLVIVVCKPCQQVGIATGTGTELILTDDICKKVIDKTMIPEFKQEEFYTGIKNGVIELIKKWN